MRQRELSRWMKALDVLVLLGCAAFAFIVVPMEALEVDELRSGAPSLLVPSLAFGVVSLVAPVAAGAVAWRIFTRIGQDNSFCVENALALRTISYLAVAEIVVFFLATLILLALHLLNSGMLLMLLGITVAFVALAVIAAALSHLTLKAARLQDENDLTV